MSHTLSIEEAAAHLADLVSSLQPGEEIKLTAQNRLVARIVPEGHAKSGPPYRRGGACKGMLTENATIDDDAHLADFKEYMA